MKTNKLILVLLLFVVTFSAFSQVKIGDNPTTIDNSAVLELESTIKGFLPPRMTTAQRNAIANPAKGLTIFNTNIDCVEVNNGSSSTPKWVSVCDLECDSPSVSRPIYTTPEEIISNYDTDGALYNETDKFGVHNTISITESDLYQLGKRPCDNAIILRLAHNSNMDEYVGGAMNLDTGFVVHGFYEYRTKIGAKNGVTNTGVVVVTIPLPTSGGLNIDRTLSVRGTANPGVTTRGAWKVVILGFKQVELGN